jgi:DNA-binding MarR family transcriptional regulator
MYQPELMQIAESLTGLLPRLVRGLSSPGVSKPGKKELVDDLPLAQLRLCGMLGEGPRAMSVLSRELGVSLSALTQTADRLERVRLVKRTSADEDRRVRCLQLTPRGERMMRKRRDARLRSNLAVLEQLSASERQLVHTAMETLVSACARAECVPPAQRRVVAAGIHAAGNGTAGNGTAGNGNGAHRNHRSPYNKTSTSRTPL